MASFGKIFIYIVMVAFIGCSTATLLSELCIRKERVCEGRTLSIRCPSGRTIFVTHAAYGRTEGGDVCPHPQVSDQNCLASSSLRIVQQRCNGRFSCSVGANNGVFTDPCVGTYKYLEVTYHCA